METIVLVLMILVCFSFMLKQSFRKLLSVGVIALVAALFTGLMWPVAIEQSRSQIEAWLANPQLMLDTSVVLSVEVALQMAFCIMAVNIQTEGHIKRWRLTVYKLLRWFPGVLIFPVLFSALVYAVFSFPGYSFPAVAWSLAAAVLIIIPAGSCANRHFRHSGHSQRAHGSGGHSRSALGRIGGHSRDDTRRTGFRLDLLLNQKQIHQ